MQGEEIDGRARFVEQDEAWSKERERKGLEADVRAHTPALLPAWAEA